jgi:hypothetical protein
MPSSERVGAIATQAKVSAIVHVCDSCEIFDRFAEAS